VSQTWRVMQGDVLDRLGDMPDESVQCVVTSPPYWGLRDYGVPGQIGMETTPDDFVARLVDVFREVRRVLRGDGVLWLNLGDSYAGSGKGAWNREGVQKEVYVPGVTGAKIRSEWPGLKPKDLVGIPWLVAFALRADGWYLRQDIIWSKPSPMPESVRDRCTKAHEYLFMLTKSARYYFDAEAIAEPALNPDGFKYAGGYRDTLSLVEDSKRVNVGSARLPNGTVPHYSAGFRDKRNRRSVWHIATEPFPEAHFATFPTALVEPCIKAGSKQGDLILDPFSGSGTTGVVALELGRNYVGIELNLEYVEMSLRRLGNVAPLLAREGA
jgi:DNA modification methylase